MKTEKIIATVTVALLFLLMVFATYQYNAHHECKENSISVAFIVIMQGREYEIWEIKGEKYLVDNNKILANCRYLTTCKWAI